MLLIFDYVQIRVVITLVLAILAIIVTTSIAENKGNIIASFYLLSLVCVEYFYIGLSLLNSITFLIMMTASLILVKRFDKIKDFGLFFFVIGMFIGFFGLLDAPLLTFGGPLLLYFVFKDEEKNNDFIDLSKFFFFWILGYFLTWMTKWILMDLIYNRNLIKTAVFQIFYRSVGGNYSSFLAICINLLCMAIPIMIVVFTTLYFYVKYYKNVNFKYKKARVYWIISILPIIWYIILSNHSINHYFFTYRLLFITMFSYLLGVYHFFGKPEK